MGYKNYVSVYCDNRELIKNYSKHYYPLKNAPYALSFESYKYNDDTAYTLKDRSFSVRVTSCENRVHYVFSNIDLNKIDFSLDVVQRSSDNSEYVQIYFKGPSKDTIIMMYENQYTNDEEILKDLKNNELIAEYLPITLSSLHIAYDTRTYDYESFQVKYVYSVKSGLSFIQHHG